MLELAVGDSGGKIYLMQMTFNIPAALGVALVTSVIGTLTASKVGPGLGLRTELREVAAEYAGAVQDGDTTRADGILAGLPQDSVDAVKAAVVLPEPHPRSAIRDPSCNPPSSAWRLTAKTSVFQSNLSASAALSIK